MPTIAQPDDDLGSYEEIYLGGEAAAIVPLPELPRLQAVQRTQVTGVSRDPGEEIPDGDQRQPSDEGNAYQLQRARRARGQVAVDFACGHAGDPRYRAERNLQHYSHPRFA
jgi:hypothetical protein